MSDFRLRPGKPVAQELAHVLDVQLSHARAQLKNWAGEPERAFHEARRRLKKARAAARVARGIDEPLSRKIGDHIRDASAALSEPRDDDVVRTVAGKLAAEIEVAGVARTLAKFAHAKNLVADRSDREKLARKSLRRIEQALDASKRLRDAETPAKALRRAAKRAFHRADRAFIEAHPAAGLGVKATEEIRHEWRKRVKDLWYVERLLEDSWPIERRPRERLTNRLGKMLGAERDLLLLTERLRVSARACGGAKARDTALAYVQNKRDAMLVEAEALGRRVHGAEFPALRAAAARARRGAPRLQKRAPAKRAPAKRTVSKPSASKRATANRTAAKRTASNPKPAAPRRKRRAR